MPLVTIHIIFVPKTYLYKAHITTTRSLVTCGFRKKNPKIWGYFALNLDYGQFQQPKEGAHNVFLKIIRTYNAIYSLYRRNGTFFYYVKVSCKLYSAILLFQRQWLQSPLMVKHWIADILVMNTLKCMLWYSEGSCHKKHWCQIWKPYKLG